MNKDERAGTCRACLEASRRPVFLFGGLAGWLVFFVELELTTLRSRPEVRSRVLPLNLLSHPDAPRRPIFTGQPGCRQGAQVGEVVKGR